MSRSLKEIVRNPMLLFMTLGHRELLNWVDDETYLKIAFKASIGRNLNLNDPKTFNEKLQWLKLHDRNPEYTTMVDKYEAKKWVADKIGGGGISSPLSVFGTVLMTLISISCRASLS